MKQRPIVSLWALLRSHRVPSKDNEPFSLKEMERSRGPADIQTGDAADLKSELIKAFGASQTSEASELGMGTGDPPQRGREVIVNLFKAGDTQLPGITGDHPGINLPQDVYKHVAQAHGLRGSRRRSEAKDPAQTTCSCSRASSRAGKANKTVYAFFLDVRKAYDTVWRDGLSAKLLESVDGKLWRVLRDLAVKSTSEVRVNGDLSEAFPLSGVG
jgi:hypothetical protein